MCNQISDIPDGYTPGQTKFVIVIGTVMSGFIKAAFDFEGIYDV